MARSAATSAAGDTGFPPAGTGPALTEEAFRVLYPALRRFAAVVGDADMDPDDLVHDALAGLLGQPPGHVRDVTTYLRRSIVHGAASTRRRLARARALPDRLARPAADRDPVYPSDLDAVLESVPPRDRALLYLLDVEGVPMAEAARSLDLSVVAVKARASRARRAARRIILREERHDA